MHQRACLLSQLISLLLLLGCSQLDIGLFTTRPEVHEGVLDLSQWQFQQKGVIPLSGAWAFHWQKLVEPDQPLGEPAGFYHVPQSWTWHGHKPAFPIAGVGTYELVIRLPENAPDLYIRDFIVAQDFQVRVNGKIIRPWASKPGEWGPQLLSADTRSYRLPLDPGTRSAVLTVEVRNRDFILMSGFHRVPYIGTLHALVARRELALSCDVFIFACMLIMGVYHFFIYGFRPSSKINLIYAIALCVLALLVLTNNEGLYKLATESDRYLVKAYCLLAYGVSIAFFIYTYHFFPDEYDRRVHRAQCAFFAVLLPIVALTPFSVYWHTIYVFQVGTCLSILYVILVVIKAIRAHRQGALLYLLASMVVFIAGINDMLYAIGIIHTWLMSSWSGLLYVTIQSLLLSRRYAAALKVESSVETARLVQASMLPAAIDIPGLSIRGVYQAAEAAGGDWYYYFYDAETEDFYIFMADVVGHGISSAIVTGTVSGIIRTTLHLQRRESPAARLLDIMKEANRGLRDMSSDAATHAMTMVAITFNLRTGQASFVNAGHTPPVQRQGGACSMLLRPSSPLGIIDDPQFHSQEFQIKERVLLFVYTDGLFENKNALGKHLKIRSVLQLLNQGVTAEDFFAKLNGLTAALWRGVALEDDVTWLVIDWDPAAFQQGGRAESSASPVTNIQDAGA